MPGLCHHDAVPANASCRLCLVEIRRPGRDWTQLTTSCDYPVSAGLEVVTDSPRIRELRAMNVRLLLRRAPRGAGAAASSPSGSAWTSRRSRPSTTRRCRTASSASSACACCSAAGYDALAVSGRGSGKYVGPAFGHAAAEDCVGCASCVEVCPTDCISMVDTATTRTIWGRTFDLLTCERCGKPITTREHRATIDAGIDAQGGRAASCATPASDAGARERLTTLA